MKFGILSAIILIHLVVLGFLFGPCRPDPDAKGSDVTEQVVEGPDGDETEDESGSGDTSPSQHYGPGFYTDALSPLPTALETASKTCRGGIAVDWTSRSVLWEKQDTTAYPIASLTKMMTVLLLMESLEQDQELTLQTPVRVTKQASKVGGRQVWLDPRDGSFTIDQLLKCTLVFSANDAAYLLGQFLGGGDHQTFVDRMNSRAHQLGLTHFTFHNANGLPEGNEKKENKGCARELSYLAGSLLEYPQVLKWSQTTRETLTSDFREKKGDEPTMLTTTNKLLGNVRGVNGMKTGFTNAAGWCMAATCERDGRVVIVVVTGCKVAEARNALVKNLIEWAYKGN